MTQHYDVAVVGGQLSGVVAAALLAKRGRRVLLVDHGENTTSYRYKGRILPLVPTLVPAFEASPPVRQVYEELGLGPDMRTSLQALEPSFQAILPEHRIDIYSDPQRVIEELGLEFPELTDGLRRFFDGLFELDEEISSAMAEMVPVPPGSLTDRLFRRNQAGRFAAFDVPFEQHDLLAGIPEDHPVREILLGPLTFFGHLWTEQPSTLHAVRLIARYFRGVVTPHDRLGGPLRLLLEAAERAGVDVRREAVVETVLPSGRQLQSLRLRDDRHDFTADYFVDNTPAGLVELLPADKRHPKYAVEAQSSKPERSLLVLNLVVDGAVIPRGMAEALFLLNGRRSARGEAAADPPLFLRRYPAARASGKSGQNGHETLCIATPVRLADVRQSPERFAALRRQMLGRASRLVPFLDDYLKEVSLPVETGHWDIEEGDTRRVDPWVLHPIYEAATRPLLGVALRSPRTFFKNLVHCGHDIYPGLGIEGDYLAGMLAAETLEQLAGKRWKR